MTDTSGPAFPTGPTDQFIQSPHGGMERASAYGWEGSSGLSKRELFAAMAMHSLILAQLTNQETCMVIDARAKSKGITGASETAMTACFYADALLAALERNKPDA